MTLLADIKYISLRRVLGSPSVLSWFFLIASMVRVLRLGARSSTYRSLWSISLEVLSSSCWGNKASCSGVKYRGGPE